MHGANFLNLMLPIVEKVLKIKDARTEVKVTAFRAWRTLIDSFALERSTLPSHRGRRAVAFHLFFATFKILQLSRRTEKSKLGRVHFESDFHTGVAWQVLCTGLAEAVNVRPSG